MSTSPVLEMQVTKEVRIERLVREYGHADKEAFLLAMNGIVKKLGGQHFIAARDKLFENDMSATIDILLTYYDKAYQTGLTNKEQRIRSRIAWNGKDPEQCADELISFAG
jgi:tRNA 2-selenouridine synthase